MGKNPKSDNNQASFDDQLVLFRYMLGKIGVSTLKELANPLNSCEYEGIDENGNTHFCRYIIERCERKGLPINKDLLKQYDGHICKYTAEIGDRRGGITWKYFQYISLLFTEMYLDRYFNDCLDFASDLNKWLDNLYDQSMGAINLSPYTPDNMRKLAFMCATGSGKTLMMHVNIKQFLYYLKRAQRINSHLKINNIILLSPNESMSLQHFDELKLSSIKAKIFEKDLFDEEKGNVLILDMNKLKEEGKVKTVSVDSFEKDNLVLVDEAHRGLTSGDIWYDYRTRLCEEGFSFEYSATFKQSLKANSSKKQEKLLMDEYGKSIIVDYSYKHFYRDGYGKHSRIYNLQNELENEHQQLYLTGCLLSYFQQLKYFNDNLSELAVFNLEKPLLVFVGNKVTATTTKDELSDVQEVILFIDRFIRNKHDSAQRIEAVLKSDTGLIDSKNRDLFQHSFDALWDAYDNHIDGKTIYEDIIRVLFNSDSLSEEPRLHLDSLKQTQGEIGMKIGEYGDYFGVINIGDVSKLLSACEKQDVVVGSEEFKADSLFRQIGMKDSPMNVLIGSRKFTEGWNSWRVSTMGLINFGKSEGSQAIQLFGRGVRLKGYNMQLKRSSAIPLSFTKPKHIECVETLSIYGVKAKYMEMFSKMLKDEGAQSNMPPQKVNLPVINRFEELKGRRLKVLRIKNGINFKKQAKRFLLDLPDEDFLRKLLQAPTKIDCRSKVDTLIAEGASNMHVSVLPKELQIRVDDLVLLDRNRIYDELEQYREEKAYFNLTIKRDVILHILAIKDWYKLVIPERELILDSLAKIETATDYAIIVLKSYIDRYYRNEKARWEAPYLEYADLTSDDDSFVDTYEISYKKLDEGDNGYEDIKRFITEASAILEKSKGLDVYKLKDETNNTPLVLFDFRSHLYAPLITLRESQMQIQISPVNLNIDEERFVDMLKDYTETHKNDFADKGLYLLRNKSKSGMGFFEAGNFYPDFILWIDTEQIQYISFIDPKGLRNIPFKNPKIQFGKRIKEIETRMQTSGDEKRIVLNSFIMSGTPSSKLNEMWPDIDIHKREDNNVYLLEDYDCVEKMISKILFSKSQ